MNNNRINTYIIDSIRTPFGNFGGTLKGVRTDDLGAIPIKELVKRTGIDAITLAKKMEKLGAGEILLTSMDKDGTKSGFDLELTKKISNNVNIPVIASGGVGNIKHLVDGIKIGKASAVLAASIFHYGKYTVRQVKNKMKQKGILVRI